MPASGICQVPWPKFGKCRERKVCYHTCCEALPQRPGHQQWRPRRRLRRLRSKSVRSACLAYIQVLSDAFSLTALRIRPPTQQDNTSIPARFQRPVIHAASSTSVEVEMTPSATAGPGAPTAAGAKKQYFTFDQVHGPSTTQHEMFTTTAEPLITRFVDGFNCTVLAYGQTSSGKTFTMTGMDLDADPTDPSNGMGIIPRAVSGIFARARQLKEEKGSAWTFGLKGSFIEIYNEDLIDLLAIDDGSGGRREVQIREEKGHIIWAGLREVNVKSSGEVMS